MWLFFVWINRLCVYSSAMIVIESSQVEGFTKTIYGRGGYKKKEEDHVRVVTALHIQNISIQTISGHTAIHYWWVNLCDV